MITLSLPEYHKENIIQPFLKGKYSEIDKTYVTDHYKPFIFQNAGKTLSRNWMILNKHPLIKKEWEDILGMELPKEAEVWSRPIKNDEIYAWKEYAETKGIDPTIEVW